MQDGALLLNKLLQDVVRECDVFDLERFVPLLERRIYHPGPAVRQFLIGWVRVLDSVPNLDMLQYLPNILDGLLQMLGDRHPEIAREVGATLSGFLGEIKARASTPLVEFGTLTSILVKHCGEDSPLQQQTSPSSSSPPPPQQQGTPQQQQHDEYTHYVALGWLHQFVVSGCDRLLPYSAQLLSAILPSMSHDVDEIRDTAVLANEELLRLIGSTKAPVPIERMLEKIMGQFSNPNVESRLAALNWVRILHQKDAAELAPFFADLFPALIKKIGDPSEKVVSFSLEVMAMISRREEYFSRLVSSLVDMFAADQGLQSARGALIIRQLSLFIDPTQIFTAIARVLQSHENLSFCASMVQTLSVILLTARELQPLRDRLRTFRRAESADPVIAAFFVTLYEAFCHNAVATVSLCLLCELYEHATTLLVIIGGMDMTVDFLCELDKLVQLIESPVFASMRLQLLVTEQKTNSINHSFFCCFQGTSQISVSVSFSVRTANDIAAVCGLCDSASALVVCSIESSAPAAATAKLGREQGRVDSCGGADGQVSGSAAASSDASRGPAHSQRAPNNGRTNAADEKTARQHQEEDEHYLK